MPNTVVIKVTSAFLVGGKLVKAGEMIEVPTADAKDLLHRGKAILSAEPQEKPRVAIHYTEEVHVPEAPAAVEADESAGDEVQAEPAKPKRSKKAK